MKKRPKLEIKITLIDKSLEIFSCLLLIACWTLVIMSYTHLPDVIPIHFDAGGQADGFGNKRAIFSLPIVATGMFILFTIINRYPHIFNYAVKITADNALRQYTNMTRMIRVLKLIVVVIFFAITIKTIQFSAKETDGLGAWLLPLTLVITFFIIIYFTAKSFFINKSRNS